MSVVKGGLIWNFFCTFIVSSVYDSSGSGINKVKILVSTIKAAPSCGFNFVFVFGFFFFGMDGKIHRHTNVLLKPLYFNTSQEDK